ncbi:MAG: hypothetical protein COW84_01285 [Gammaproteobacteria bacterium CG22_combo_CG10-13_8_21_14_all_40_8]|nr:MAG: hypothetical protein COW84_01285 [Gammaproteobacteria bacterium CG22_combo_CG10-13_8_21_14_all_40_8]
MQDLTQQSRRVFLKNSLSTAAWVATTTSGLLIPGTNVVAKLPSQLPLAKSIYELKGEVLVDGIIATNATLITPNSLVITRSNSYVIFKIGEDAHILRENSQIQLQGDGIIVSTLRLISGKILSVFGKRESSKPYQLHTTTATIGIRGTGVYAESYTDSSYLCTCYGVVNIQANRDTTSQEIISATHHDSPRFILASGQSGKLIEPAPMKNHSDEELMLIETIVGRTAPLSFIKGYKKPRRRY